MRIVDFRQKINFPIWLNIRPLQRKGKITPNLSSYFQNDALSFAMMSFLFCSRKNWFSSAIKSSIWAHAHYDNQSSIQTKKKHTQWLYSSCCYTAAAYQSSCPPVLQSARHSAAVNSLHYWGCHLTPLRLFYYLKITWAKLLELHAHIRVLENLTQRSRQHQSIHKQLFVLCGNEQHHICTASVRSYLWAFKLICLFICFSILWLLRYL